MLYDLIGIEKSTTDVQRALRSKIQEERPPVVGAHLVICSDEAEYEVPEVFRRDVVRTLLPAMHFDDRAAFQTANLGARYEWGSVRVAEDHYALAKGAQDWKLMLIKIHAHVGADEIPGEPSFGRLSRYGAPSTCCGALNALLAGNTLPFALELRETFTGQGVDRCAELLEVPEDRRALLAAITQARLQARRAMLDVQDHQPDSPTLYWILPSVTFNRHHHDSEILVGAYLCDRRGDTPREEYRGLGDRPSAYRVRVEHGGVVVEDPEMHTLRSARDHRQLVREAWNARRDSHAVPHDADLKQALSQARDHDGADHAVTRALLKGLLKSAAAVSPVPAAMVLFGEGILAIHHSTRAHRLVAEAQADPVARHMLAEMHGSIDELEPEQAQHLVELLVREYGATRSG